MQEVIKVYSTLTSMTGPQRTWIVACPLPTTWPQHPSTHTDRLTSSMCFVYTLWRGPYSWKLELMLSQLSDASSRNLFLLFFSRTNNSQVRRWRTHCAFHRGDEAVASGQCHFLPDFCAVQACWLVVGDIRWSSSSRSYDRHGKWVASWYLLMVWMSMKPAPTPHHDPARPLPCDEDRT